VKSLADPLTSSEILVPVDVGAKINGEPAKTEHAGLLEFNVAEQAVLPSPGPIVRRSRETPLIVIKPTLPDPGGG
jgi:hypothetical protein